MTNFQNSFTSGAFVPGFGSSTSSVLGEFGSSTGATCTGFGSSSSPFGSTNTAFGASSSPSSGFTFTPVFRQSSSPLGTTSSHFGASSSPSSGFTFIPAFRQSSSPLGTTSSHFGAQSSLFGGSNPAVQLPAFSQPPTQSTPSIFYSTSTPALGSNPSPLLFNSGLAPSPFGGMNSNTQSAGLFQFTAPSLGQTGSIVEQTGSTFGENSSLEMNRISALPMPIIFHILSFLPTKEVVRTCVLSKGWINIWSSVPSFHFNSRLFRSTKTFIKFVNSVLFLRDGSDMQNVSLSIVGSFDYEDLSRIKEWITYAVRHNVQVLDIENGCGRNIQLTPHLFTFSLKDGQLDEALFSASPSLETLVLENCNITSVEEMVRTCVLSKGWRNVWSTVPSFHFDHDLYLSKKKRDFFKFVESVLFRRDGLDIQKFSLSLRYGSRSGDMHRVNSWIIYALRHNVQVLHISNDDDTSIALSAQIFTCESLREFKLCNEDLKLPTLISLPVLTTLHLSSVVILNGHLHVAFFSACPCLETLILEECEFVNCYTVTISASQLKNLRISSVVPASVVISTPKLVSIEMIGMENPSIRFTCELKFISDVNFDIELDQSSESTALLISTVRNAQSLTLSTLFLQSMYVENDPSLLSCIQTPFSNLKRLKIGTLFSYNDIMLIKNLLRHSPQIEYVILGKYTDDDDDIKGKYTDDDDDIKGKYTDDDDDIKGKCEDYEYTNQVELFEEEDMMSNCKLSHLKLVEIQGFRGYENEVKLVKFFLGNATVLEQMFIMVSNSDKRRCVDNQEMMKIGRKLLRHPRASSSVGILLLQDL
ncbi:hypothetical protein IFM89_007941 [Coptis chinensis]|uniref:F-box domain-containing protein n=1 Tax=Coptis chinensis TaxID=261450 RepID=A0A835IKP5_9MAGN|nr:hypothetical protein IFM89_007941 [Coptis chinensis]